MPKVSHIHKLKRHTYKSGNQVYFCTLPDCNFKLGVEFALGKVSICWRCEEPFRMNEYSIRLAKPHCEKCHGTKSAVPVIKSSGEYNGAERRVIPTRRELDPTVLPEVAESVISDLKDKLEGVSYKEIPNEMVIDDDSDIL